MTFWSMVGAGYVALIVAGFVLGRFLASRRSDGWGRGVTAAEPPDPTGPAHTVEWLPLGTAFDRALLPAAFEDAPVTADVA